MGLVPPSTTSQETSFTNADLKQKYLAEVKNKYNNFAGGDYKAIQARRSTTEFNNKMERVKNKRRNSTEEL